MRRVAASSLGADFDVNLKTGSCDLSPVAEFAICARGRHDVQARDRAVLKDRPADYPGRLYRGQGKSQRRTGPRRFSSYQSRRL